MIAVLVFLLVNQGLSVKHPVTKRWEIPLPIPQPRWTKEYLSTPSASLSGRASALPLPAPNEQAELFFFRHTITTALSQVIKPSLTDGLFVCFKTLLELHLGRPSSNVPRLGDPWSNLPRQEDHDYLSEKTTLKYYRWPKDTRTGDSPADRRMQSEISSLWSRLRDELDMHRMMAEHISRYVQRHFQGLRDGQQAALDIILDGLRLRHLDLELSEANLRDRLAMHRSETGAEMAQLSIRESKRVILRMPLPAAKMYSS